jgi:hypothetical protein
MVLGTANAWIHRMKRTGKIETATNRVGKVILLASLNLYQTSQKSSFFCTALTLREQTTGSFDPQGSNNLF